MRSHRIADTGRTVPRALQIEDIGKANGCIGVHLEQPSRSEWTNLRGLSMIAKAQAQSGALKGVASVAATWLIQQKVTRADGVIFCTNFRRFGVHLALPEPITTARVVYSVREKCSWSATRKKSSRSSSAISAGLLGPPFCCWWVASTIYAACIWHLITEPTFSWWALAGISLCTYATYTPHA